MASPIAQNWVYATVLLYNEWGKVGTGFLVCRNLTQDKPIGKIFIVTNKHVLNEDFDKRRSATKIEIFFNTNDQGKLKPQRYTLSLQPPNQKWKEHPSLDIDVLAIDATEIILSFPGHALKWVDYSLFADQNILKNEDITIGEEVLIIGYPQGLSQGHSASPLVRQGIVATKIGEPITFIRPDKSNVFIPAFLVDGGVVPGSSGSPVVLKPVNSRLVGSTIQMGTAKPYLLGIISTTQIVTVGDRVKSFNSLAGLGTAIDATQIRETIELFFQQGTALP